MILHLNFPGSLSSRQAEQQQQQIRQARKELKERVRHDWDYPTLPAHRSCGHRAPRKDENEIADQIAGFRFHHSSNHDRQGPAGGSLELGFEPTEWRERHYSSASDSEDESSAPKLSSNGSSKAKQKAYKFDSPESVGAQLNERTMARKRKRQKALEEEIEWNDGLAHWMRRRDAWCCARTPTQVNVLESHASASASSVSSVPEAAAPSSVPDSSSAASSSTSSSSLTSPRTSTSTNLTPPTFLANSNNSSNNYNGVDDDDDDDDGGNDANEDAEPSLRTPISTPSSTPDLPLLPTTTDPRDPYVAAAAPALAVLLPVAPPLLPNHPIRRRIAPHMYPEIYGKVIVQSRAPSVPLNLGTLIRALVQGWKDDGEWPPKAAVPEKSLARRKGAVAATLAQAQQQHQHMGKSNGLTSSNHGHQDGAGGGSSLRQGVRAVGRVLRLTGTES